MKFKICQNIPIIDILKRGPTQVKKKGKKIILSNAFYKEFSTEFSSELETSARRKTNVSCNFSVFEFKFKRCLERMCAWQ